MSDPRVLSFAKLLARYSIYAKKGETIGVEGPDTTAPLMEAVYEELLRAGAYPIVRMTPARCSEIFFRHGQPLHFDAVPKFELAYAKAIDGSDPHHGQPQHARALRHRSRCAWPASPRRAARCGACCSRRNGRSPSSPPRRTRRTRR
jgi:hypothetical protein